jgi:hypothetical protein
MLDAQEFLAKIDDLDIYDDYAIIEISVFHFGEEVRIRIAREDDKDGVITFFDCRRTEMQNVMLPRETISARDYKYLQICHSFQTAEVEIVELDGYDYYKVTMDLFPQKMVVYCRDVKCEIVKNPARGQDCERYRELPEGYTY